MEHVVIIGAGAAGLAAAADIARAGRRYCLIEAQPWIGGEALHAQYCSDVHGAHLSGIAAAQRALAHLAEKRFYS